MSESHCWYDVVTGRYVLEGRDLHCGDCFEVLVCAEWRHVRIELSGDVWYLVGMAGCESVSPGHYPARFSPC
jgi:hypothetical protein